VWGFPIDTGVHTSDCQKFKRRFRSASFDRATKLEAIFPDAWLDHFEAKFDALIIHEASPYPTRRPEMPDKSLL
jgi:hypothetical protein